MSFGRSVLSEVSASALLALLVSLIVGLFSQSAAFSDYELWGYDFLVNHATHGSLNSDVVIVDFDDATFDRINQYPIPRSLIADVIARVADGAPRIVGLDLFLAEPRTQEQDDRLSAALAKAGNVVLASQARKGGIPAVRPLPQFCQPEVPEQDSGDCKEMPAGAFGYAAVNLPVDSDGFIRSFFLFSGEASKGVSFPVMIAQLAKEEALKPVSSRAVRFLGHTIPTASEASRRVLIGEWCIECIKHISAISLLDEPAGKNSALAGKIVLVGQSNDAARDLMLTPIFRPKRDHGPRTRLSGVELHAAAIETLLSGRGVAVLSPFMLWPIVFCLLVLSVWLQLRYSLRASTLAVCGLILLAYVAAQGFFNWGHGWFQYTTAIFGLALSVPAAVAYRFVRERLLRSAAVQERAQVMGLFSRYVSPEVAQQIWKRRDEVILAGEERTATVLFSDIRSFTALTAGKDSSIVLRWLNEYLTAMDEVIRTNGGFLNKFIGDGLMVLFGVPLSEGMKLDACRAVRCAVEMQERVEVLNSLHADDGDFPKIKIGIGVHTGKLTCGNIGSRDRVEYSVIGETVNLASRLESLTKEFNSAIVVSAATHSTVREEFPSLCELGEAPVRGFEGQIRLYGFGSNPGESN
jgi:class 3 adenylate cyclase/CHASE2 domain-containing sensor protein